MARKPNYSFERTQRERAKSAKQDAKREARAGAKAAAAAAPAVDEGVSDRGAGDEPATAPERRTPDRTDGDVAGGA